MDERKIIIVNLSKGLVGENNANLLGAMLITKMYLAAMSRADASPAELAKLPNFYLYVDEFQSFANKSFADILSEARKYKLSLNITHQYIEQMDEEVRAAVFGNVGTMITFRVGSYDAEVLEKEFAPVFTAQDIVNLGFTQIYLRLMIDGVGSQPFSGTTLPPIQSAEASHREQVLAFSRSAYASPKAEVEKAIREWHEPEKQEAKDRPEKREERRPDRQKEERREERREEPKREPRPEAPRSTEAPVRREREVPPEGNSSLGKAILEALNSKQVVAETNQVSVKQKDDELPQIEQHFRQTTVKLADLKKDEKNNSKEATPEKKNALKEALEKLNSSKETVVSSKEEAIKESEKPREETKKHVPEVSNLGTPTPNLKKEVPEDVLRKVLNG